jgi:hypothetical protein
MCTEHARRTNLFGETEEVVCSFCGAKLGNDYYLLLSTWRSETKELVSPRMRFCEDCWGKIEKIVYHQVRQLKMPITVI